jgi:hypothetical protein
MADIPIATLTPKDVNNHGGATGGINPSSENDIAVKFMTIVAVFLLRKKLIFTVRSVRPHLPQRG